MSYWDRDPKKLKRKEPLPDNYENTQHHSKKKKRVIRVWKFTYHWWKKSTPPKWERHYKKYYTEEAAVLAIKKEINEKLFWNKYYFTDKGREIGVSNLVPFYWIGDNPPDTES